MTKSPTPPAQATPTAATAGPWHAYNADYQGRPDEGPIFTVGPSEFHTVAQVRAGNTDDDLPTQTPANARLIASAPALRDALINAVALWEYSSTDAPQRAWLAQARAALASSGGGT